MEFTFNAFYTLTRGYCFTFGRFLVNKLIFKAITFGTGCGGLVAAIVS
jgi:hypothetical protein